MAMDKPRLAKEKLQKGTPPRGGGSFLRFFSFLGNGKLAGKLRTQACTLLFQPPYSSVTALYIHTIQSPHKLIIFQRWHKGTSLSFLFPWCPSNPWKKTLLRFHLFLTSELFNNPVLQLLDKFCPLLCHWLLTPGCWRTGCEDGKCNFPSTRFT